MISEKTALHMPLMRTRYFAKLYNTHFCWLTRTIILTRLFYTEINGGYVRREDDFEAQVHGFIIDTWAVGTHKQLDAIN